MSESDLEHMDGSHVRERELRRFSGNIGITGDLAQRDHLSSLRLLRVWEQLRAWTWFARVYMYTVVYQSLYTTCI